MSNIDWHFDPPRDNVRAIYLCWRAVGYDVWDSLALAFRGFIPANWAFLYDDD